MTSKCKMQNIKKTDLMYNCTWYIDCSAVQCTSNTMSPPPPHSNLRMGMGTSIFCIWQYLPHSPRLARKIDAIRPALYSLIGIRSASAWQHTCTMYICLFNWFFNCTHCLINRPINCANLSHQLAL